MSPHVVAVGYGSEFSLNPLCDALEDRGILCTRIDMFDGGWRERYQPNGEVVLLTSQHPSISRSIYAKRFGQAHDLLNLTETIGFFQPVRSFLFPHDLASPFLDEEIPYMQELTAILAPDERFWCFSRWVPVHVVGWPKLIEPSSAADASGIVLMPTDVAVFAQYGADHFRATFAGLMRPGVRFKLPVFPGTEALRAALLDAGCEEIPADTNSAEVIARHATIVSNALSSIVLESALTGKDVICVKCGIHDAGQQMRAFSSYPNVELVDPADLAAALTSPRRGKTYPAELKPLDLDMVVALIEGGHQSTLKT